MDCDTLQVVDGSVLTFEAITRLCESPIPPSNITANYTFEFNNYLSDRLKINNSNAVEVYFSKDNINYKKITNFNKIIILYPEIGSNLGYYLGVTTPINEIKFYSIFIKKLFIACRIDFFFVFSLSCSFISSFSSILLPSSIFSKLSL